MRAIYREKARTNFAIMVFTGFIFIVFLFSTLVIIIPIAVSFQNKDFPPDPLKLCGKEDRVINCTKTPNFNCCQNNTGIYCYNAFQINGYLCLNITREFKDYSQEITDLHNSFGSGYIVASICVGISVILFVVTAIFGFIAGYYDKLEKIAATVESQAAAS